VSSFYFSLPFKKGSVIPSVDASIDIRVSGAKSYDRGAWLVGNGHVGGGEGDVIDYLIRCSACRDFKRSQNRYMFAMQSRRR